MCIFDMKYGLPVKVRDKLVAATGGVLPKWASRLLPAPPAYLQDGKQVEANMNGAPRDHYAIKAKQEDEEAESMAFAERVERLTKKLCIRNAPLAVLPPSMHRAWRGAVAAEKLEAAAILEGSGEQSRPYTPLLQPYTPLLQPLVHQNTAPASNAHRINTSMLYI